MSQIFSKAAGWLFTLFLYCVGVLVEQGLKGSNISSVYRFIARVIIFSTGMASNMFFLSNVKIAQIYFKRLYWNNLYDSVVVLGFSLVGVLGTSWMMELYRKK